MSPLFISSINLNLIGAHLSGQETQSCYLGQCSRGSFSRETPGKCGKFPFFFTEIIMVTNQNLISQVCVVL